MNTVELEGEHIDASTDDGLKKAQELDVSAVPTVIFFDEQGKEISRASSKDEIDALLN